MSPRDRLATWTTDTPLNLAVFRVTLGVVFFLLPDLHDAARWAALPEAVRVAPIGVGFALDSIPITRGLADASYAVLLGGLALGTVGLLTRLAWTAVTLASLYLLLLPQLGGAAFHYHHLVWFSALLAASPSGDALSLDRVIAKRLGAPPPPERALVYGVPLRAAWLLLGVIFFFPGFHKLATSGWEWIWSDNLRNQMYAKWLQKPEFTPLFRIDRYPTLVRLGALSVVVFELSFVFLVPFRRTRLWAVAAALAFHQLTAYFMSLRFSSLWLCYVCFVDWSALVVWARAKLGRTAPSVALEASPARRARWLLPPLAFAFVLVAGNTAFGALGLNDGWPFACYPKFDRIVRARLPALEVELVHRDGSTSLVPVEHMSRGGATQRWWALSWSLLGAHERARASPERFRAFWDRVSRGRRIREASVDATHVRFHRVMRSTIPEEREAPPLSRRLVCELPLDDAQ